MEDCPTRKLWAWGSKKHLRYILSVDNALQPTTKNHIIESSIHIFGEWPYGKHLQKQKVKGIADYGLIKRIPILAINRKYYTGIVTGSTICFDNNENMQDEIIDKETNENNHRKPNIFKTNITFNIVKLLTSP